MYFFLRDERYKGSYRKNSQSGMGDDDVIDFDEESGTSNIVDVVVVVAFFALISSRAFVRLTLKKIDKSSRILKVPNNFQKLTF